MGDCSWIQLYPIKEATILTVNDLREGNFSRKPCLADNTIKQLLIHLWQRSLRQNPPQKRFQLLTALFVHLVGAHFFVLLNCAEQQCDAGRSRSLTRLQWWDAPSGFGPTVSQSNKRSCNVLPVAYKHLLVAFHFSNAGIRDNKYYFIRMPHSMYNVASFIFFLDRFYKGK